MMDCFLTLPPVRSECSALSSQDANSTGSDCKRRTRTHTHTCLQNELGSKSTWADCKRRTHTCTCVHLYAGICELKHQKSQCFQNDFYSRSECRRILKRARKCACACKLGPQRQKATDRRQVILKRARKSVWECRRETGHTNACTKGRLECRRRETGQNLSVHERASGNAEGGRQVIFKHARIGVWECRRRETDHT